MEPQLRRKGRGLGLRNESFFTICFRFSVSNLVGKRQKASQATCLRCPVLLDLRKKRENQKQVPRTGLEPAPPCEDQHLKLARLPIPPPRPSIKLRGLQEGFKAESQRSRGSHAFRPFQSARFSTLSGSVRSPGDLSFVKLRTNISSFASRSSAWWRMSASGTAGNFGEPHSGRAK